MSREEDDSRQYQCLRKYQAIVKQARGSFVFRFDELINMVDARTRPPKRRRVSSTSSRGGNTSTTADAAPSSQPVIDQVFVDTITRLLHDLDAEDPTPSPPTHHDRTTNTQD